MIWARRIVAVLLILLFLVSFVLSLVLFRVNETFLNANFYVQELRKADFYNFVYDTAIPTGFDEATKDMDTPGVDVKAIKKDVLPAVEKAFPPEWLQAQAEGMILAVFPYITGETDQFSATIDLNSRVDTAAKAVKEILHGNAFDSLYNEMTARAADTAAENLGALPAGVKVTRDDLLSAIRTIAPEAWLVSQLENAIDQVTPYLKGTSQRFAITVPLNDRVEAAGAVLKDLLHKGDTYTFVLDTIVDTLVSSTASIQTQLPYKITLTRRDIQDAVRQVVPQEWVQARFDDVTDATVAYLTGKSDTLSVTIPLADRREAAYQTLASLADRTLEGTLTALPQCSLLEFGSALLTLPPGQLPPCRPAGVTYAQVKQLLNIDTVALVRDGLGDQIPESWTFSEADLRDIAGPETWDQLQKVRGWVINGYTFTDADLRDRLDADQQKTLDDGLKLTRQGATFTHEDMRKFIGEADDGQETLDQIDQARSGIRTARQWLPLLWVLLVALLVAIGFLGGRNWGSRLTWAAAPLVAASLLMVIVAGPVYSSAVRPEIKAAVGDQIEKADEAMQPIATKAGEIGLMIADDFFGGIRTKAVLLLVLGAVVGLGGGITLQVVLHPKHDEDESPTSTPEPPDEGEAGPSPEATDPLTPRQEGDTPPPKG